MNIATRKYKHNRVKAIYHIKNAHLGIYRMTIAKSTKRLERHYCMNEFLQSDEVLTDEEIVICAEEARLWEEEGRDDEERKN